MTFGRRVTSALRDRPQFQGRIEYGQLPERAESLGGLLESDLDPTNPGYEIVPTPLAGESGTASARARDRLGATAM